MISSYVNILVLSKINKTLTISSKILNKFTYKFKVINEYKFIFDELSNNKYDIIIFECSNNNKNELNSIIELLQNTYGLDIVILIGNVSRKGILETLRNYGDNSLQTSAVGGLLPYAFQDLLDATQSTHDSQQTLETLDRHQATLATSTSQVEQLQTELIEANKAITVLARHLERANAETERRTTLRLLKLLQPLLAEMTQDTHCERCGQQFATLVGSLEELVVSTALPPQEVATLSSREQQIVTMIKEGMSSKQISTRLSVSLTTVKTHRRNIRRKLKLTGKNSNLQQYIQLF